MSEIQKSLPDKNASLSSPRPQRRKKVVMENKEGIAKTMPSKKRAKTSQPKQSRSQSSQQKKQSTPPAKNQRISSISTSKLSCWVIIALFLGAILLGIGLVFVTHPLDKYHFRNPFIILKKTFTKLTPPPQYAMNYVEYQTLSQHISLDNKAEIRAFLQKYPTSPLAMSLRNKWLLLLAENGLWRDLIADYRPTNNSSVECYYLQALYNNGRETLALSAVKRLWLSSYKPLPACRYMFSQWQKSDDFKEKYIWLRLQSAMNSNDSTLVQQLTQMLSPEKQVWVTTWITIRQNPIILPKINLPDNAPCRKIILDGLKKWTNLNVNQAIAYWPTAQNKYHFSVSMTQDFYRTASLHLALSGDPRAENWFAKILPSYGTAQSRAWQVRFALVHKNWPIVLSIIQSMPQTEQQSNMWQYWKARALASIGNYSEANKIYTSLSSQRQYYGFLAAYQLKQPLSITQVNYPNNPNLLASYTQQIQHVKNLYQTNQLPQALQLTQDLLNQLNDPGKYALAHVFAQWGWYSESMNIVNKSPYQSDLILRFPLPHRSLILSLCQQNNVPPSLVYSLARQESNFHEDVFSSAGGLGILQITLPTARQFDPKITEKDLYHPKINITISITYLKKLTKQFNAHPLLIASAYNAGPQKTRRWQPTKNSMPADIWIETRPWEETRNYLKNTLSYDAVYQYLLGQKPNIVPFMYDIPSN